MRQKDEEKEAQVARLEEEMSQLVWEKGQLAAEKERIAAEKEHLASAKEREVAELRCQLQTPPKAPPPKQISKPVPRPEVITTIIIVSQWHPPVLSHILESR